MRVSIFCLFVMTVLPAAAFAQASNVYVTPGGTATGNCPAGTSSAPNLTPAGFNNGANWGAGPGKIGAGTTVLACGTFSYPRGQTTVLTFQAGGSSGNPVILKLDTNANFTAPSWGGSVISSVNLSNITIDGGSAKTSIIQATANGTLLTYHDSTGGCISVGSGSNITVQNITCANMYVKYCPSGDETQCSSDGDNGNGTDCIGTFGNIDHLLVRNNILHDCNHGIDGGTGYAPGGSGITGNTYSGNTIYHACIGLNYGVGATDGTPLTGLIVSGNNIYDGYNWAESSNDCHGDGMHIYFGGGANTSLVGLVVSGNFIHGNWGNSMNAWIFIEVPDTEATGAQYFNNILEDDTTIGHNGNGMISVDGNNAIIANNTINGGSPGIDWTGTGLIIENNAQTNVFQPYLRRSTATATIDYNNYYAFNTIDGTNGFSAWKKACSCDSDSSAIIPNFAGGTLAPPLATQASTNFLPTSSSVALIKQGANLTSMNITPLDSDYAGNARPGSGTCSSLGAASCWDIGANSFNSAVIAPPVNLTATVE